MASVGAVGEGISTETLVAIPSAPSPETKMPVSPHTTLVHYEPHFLHRSPRWVTENEIFVQWPFKGPLIKESSPGNFHSQMSCGLLFLGLVLWAGESGLQLRPQHLRGNPRHWDILLDSQLQHVGLGPAIFVSLLPYQSWCGFFYKSLVIWLLLS